LSVAFYLLNRVFEVLALALVEGSLASSTLGGWAESRMTEIGMSPSKLGTGEKKLSKACIQTKEM
jgi:hypothetical protein